MARRDNAIRRRDRDDETRDRRQWCATLAEALMRSGVRVAQDLSPAAPRLDARQPCDIAPDVRYEPTPPTVVSAMLRLAAVTSSDRVYDLGCGDGRVVIAAARMHGAFGVGIDVDPTRIAESLDNASRAGMLDRVRFVGADVMGVDLADATVVTLFLSPRLNMRLRPKLLRELATGTRVISHWHNMGDWRPRRVERVRSEGVLRPLYLWSICPG